MKSAISVLLVDKHSRTRSLLAARIIFRCILNSLRS